jgi:HEAT repeat protein
VDKSLSEIVLNSIEVGLKPVPIKEITTLLQSDVEDIRICAVMVIRHLKEPPLIRALVERLEREDSEVQKIIDDALVRLGETLEVPFIIPYINSFNQSERKMAFSYFGIHHPEKLTHKYINGLQNPNADIRYISLKSLLNQRSVTAEMIERGAFDSSDKVGVQAVKAVASLQRNQQTLNLIKRIIAGNPSERVKVELIQLLTGLESPNSIKIVLPLLRDDSPRVQFETVEMLKSLKDASVLDGLKKLKDSENRELLEFIEIAIRELEKNETGI